MWRPAVPLTGTAGKSTAGMPGAATTIGIGIGIGIGDDPRTRPGHLLFESAPRGGTDETGPHQPQPMRRGATGGRDRDGHQWTPVSH